MATFEDLVRLNLDAATNGKGRPVHEFSLLAENLPDGVVAVRVWPTGFNAEAEVFGLTGNGLASDVELGTQIAQAQALREAADKARDAELERAMAAERAAAAAKGEEQRIAAVAAQAAAATQAAADEQARIDTAVKIAVDGAVAAALAAAGVKLPG